MTCDGAVTQRAPRPARALPCPAPCAACAKRLARGTPRPEGTAAVIDREVGVPVG